jgi:predicted ATPase/signal transduction histidine kinase
MSYSEPEPDPRLAPSAEVDPRGVRASLAEFVGDPSLDVVFWVPEFSAWLDGDGAAVALPSGGGRAVTFIGDRLAAVMHDPRLLVPPGCARLQAAGDVFRPALEYERAQAGLRAELAELRESRARLVRGADEQRQRLERDLHDGAQQRLLGLGLTLQRLRPQLDPVQGALLADGERELRRALAELRELATGIHPAGLAEQGLASALTTVAERASVPVELRLTADRFPAHVESAIYFIVAEALANVAKHAQASRAWVAVEGREGAALVQVGDDGNGGASLRPGGGLRGLADRVGTLEGWLRVDSTPGQGTTVAAELPMRTSPWALSARVFVGRVPELRELGAALERAWAGEGRLVCVVGEPGIGKTALARELASQSRLAGGRVLWGRCYEEPGAPAYWPFVQALRAYAREVDPDQLRVDAADAAAALAEILPELMQRLGPLSPLPRADPREARFRLFDAVCSFLRRAAETQPLLLVLDDLHWADQGTLALLGALAHEVTQARLLVLGNYRDIEVDRGHPLTATLAELTRTHLYERVRLTGLAREDVRRFITAVGSVEPRPELVDAVYARTEGNPLFVSEVVRLLALEGRLEGAQEPASLRLPEGVRDVIDRRLGRLGDQCEQALQTAALFGREFALRELAAALAEPAEETLADLLEGALEAGIVAELPGRARRYQFTHALIQETLVAQLSATTRARRHGCIARTLERMYGEQVDRHAGEVAYHYGQASGPVAREKLVHYLLRAGAQAAAAHAHDESGAYYEQVLEAIEDPRDPRTAEALTGLAHAQLATLPGHEVGRAFATLRRAFDRHLELGEQERGVALACEPIVLGSSVLFERALEPARAMVERALSLVEPESPEAARLLANHGLLVAMLAGDERAHAYGSAALLQARAVARAAGDEALEATVLVQLRTVAIAHYDLPQLLEVSDAAIGLARRLGDEWIEALAHLGASAASVMLGEPERAIAERALGLPLAERLHNRALIATFELNDAIRASFHGDWALVQQRSELETERGEPRILLIRAQAAYTYGDLNEGDRCLEALRRLAARGAAAAAGYLAGAAAICGHLGNRDELLDEGSAAAVSTLAIAGLVPLIKLYALVALALAAVRRDDVPEATRSLAELERYRGVMFPGPALAADRLLGLLAGVCGDRERAHAHFERALALTSRARYRADHAWTAYEYAQSLREDDPARAHGLEQEALALTHQLGMPLLLERLA